MSIHNKIKIYIRFFVFSFAFLATFHIKAQSITNYLTLKDKTAGNEVVLSPEANTLAYKLYFPATVPTVGSVLTVNNLSATNAKLAWQAPTAFAWGLTGNSGTQTTNFLGTTDNLALRFRTNNVDRLTITGAGYLGMGTASPVSQLSNTSITIVGKNGQSSDTFSMTNTTPGWAGAFYSTHNGLNVKINSATAAYTAFEVGAGNTSQQDLSGQGGSKVLLNVLGNGNVGINTSAPGNKLEIRQGTEGNSGLRFTNLTSASSTTTSLSKVLAVNSIGDVILTNVPGTQNVVDFSLYANPNTSGTTFSPNTPSDEAIIYQSSIDNSLWTYNGSTYVTYTPPTYTAWYRSGTTNDAGSSKTAKIYRNGNVGIGTTAPAGKLHVKFDSGLEQPIWERTLTTTPITTINALAGNYLLNAGNSLAARPDNTTAIGYNFSFKSDTEPEITTAAISGGLAKYGTGKGYLSFIVNGPVNSPDPAMYINSNKNVGIGTTAPTEKLVVAGNILATGTVSGTSFVNSSDKRLKSNIANLKNGLSKVLQLRPVSYDKKSTLEDNSASVHEIGFIAQEVQKVLPEIIVEGNDKDKLLAVNYISMIPVLTKAIQEQQQKIEVQQKQINQLQQLNEMLLKRLDALEKK